MPRTTLRSERLPLPSLLPFVLALGLLSCGREATGPGRFGTAALALDPRFPAAFAVSGAGSVVPFNRVRVILDDPDGALPPVFDRTINFPADQASISLTIEVPMPPDAGPEGVPLSLRMRYINAQGDTVFRAGPIDVLLTARGSGSDNHPPVVGFDVEYVGVGANAAIVTLSPVITSAVAGTNTAFTTLAMDAQEKPLPGTPIIYSTLDPQSVQITSAGVATWLPVAGPARVIATVPSGAAADTMVVSVQLAPTGAAAVEWSGAVSSDWAVANNWLMGVVPSATDSVVVPAGTPFAPALSAPTVVRALTLASSATLSLGAHILTVRGSVNVQPDAAITALDGRLELSSATGGTVRGVLPTTRVVGGLFSLSGDVTINGSLDTYGDEFTPGVMTEGDLSVGGFNLTMTGGLFIGLAGTFTMTGPGVVDIGTYANFFGNSTAGKLTAGVMRIRGELYQDGTDSPSSFSASGSHVVEFVGNAASQRIFFTDPDASPSATCLASCFATLRSVKAPGEGGLLFQTSVKVLGELDLQADSVIATDMIIMAAGTPRIQTPILRASALGWQDSLVVNASTLELDQLIAWGGDTLLVGVGAAQNLVMGAYYLRGPLAGDVIVNAGGALTITGAADISGGLTVTGTAGMLSPDVAMTLNIGGDLAVLGTGSFLSTGAAHLTTVQGSAVFDGSAATGLSTGRLRVAGDIVQAATTSPLSMRTSAAFIIEPTGDGIITFATPAQSTIGSLFIVGANITRTLQSDVTVLDWVDLNGDGLVLQSSVIDGGGTRTIRSQRVTAGSVGGVLRNVALATQNFQSAFGLTFADFDPAAVQLEITAGSGTSRMSNVTFSTQPTGNGRYVRITDSDGSSGSTMTLEVGTGVSPAFHGGWAQAVAPATLTGWLMPAFRWTGAVDGAWDNAANWSDGIVPTATDSAHIPATFVNAPSLPASADTVRAFISDYTAGALQLNANLTVTDRFYVPMNSGVLCSTGFVELAPGATGVATISGLLDGCIVRATSGTVAAANTVRIQNGDLQVEGTALFETARQAVYVGMKFTTLDEGRLVMETDIDSLIVGDSVTFAGGSTAGLLTAGVIEVGGDFTQTGRNTDSFSASGSHVTRFVGVVPQSIDIGFPGSGLSHFGHLQLAQQNIEAWVQLNTPTVAIGMLMTDDRALSRQLRNAPSANLPAAVESRGASVANLTFVDATWTILDGAPIERMEAISFSSVRQDGVVHLAMERDIDDVRINGLTFDLPLRSGAYVRIFDPNDIGLFRVMVEGATPQNPDSFFDVTAPAALFWNGTQFPLP